MSYAGLLEPVIALTRRIGEFQMSRFRSLPPGGGEEKQKRDLVSEVDFTSEQMLLDSLKTLLPEAGFFGEETGRSGRQDLVWVIDPLDGTTNYLSGLDQFCISVALVGEGGTELGVVLRPASGEVFSAFRGGGLLHNGARAQPLPTDMSLAESVIGTGFPYRSHDLVKPFFACAEEVLGESRALRRFGAAALDLSYVACGFLQAFWESDLQPYDVAAALLFLEEQGCTVTNSKGKPYDMFNDRLIICGLPSVHQELIALVSRLYAGLGPSWKED